MEMHTHEPRVLADSGAYKKLQTFDAPGFASQFLKPQSRFRKRSGKSSNKWIAKEPLIQPR